jgi:osmotically-inducible protein OsmY
MVNLAKRALAMGLTVGLFFCVIACSTTPRKSSEQQLADKETAENVRIALNADTQIYARHISVQADNGVVHLGGYVWSNEDLYVAQRVAEGVRGVTKVVDEMELERGGIDNSAVSR